MAGRVIKRSQALVRFKNVCLDIWEDYNKGNITKEKYPLNLYCKSNFTGVTRKEFYEFIFEDKERAPSDKQIREAYYRIMEHHRYLNATKPKKDKIEKKSELGEEEYKAIEFLKSRGFRITRLEEKEY